MVRKGENADVILTLLKNVTEIYTSGQLGVK